MTVRLRLCDLKPGAEFRPYLAQWHEATASTVREVAKQYQQKFLAVSNLWDTELSKWMEGVATAVKLNRKAPDKPMFEGGAFGTGDARFFADITAPEAAFGVGLERGFTRRLVTATRLRLDVIEPDVDVRERLTVVGDP